VSENDKSASGKWTEIDQSEIDPRRRKFMDEVVRPVGLSWLNCNVQRNYGDRWTIREKTGREPLSDIRLL